MSLHEVLDIALCSDSGVVRAHNEDSVFADADLGLAILADGMGGYNAGEVASGMATSLLATGFARLLRQAETDEKLLENPEQLIEDEVRGSNAAIFNASQTQAKYSGMGTTLVLAWFVVGRMYIAHVGDSRAYRWRDGKLVALTRDHSLLQEQIDNGMISLDEARVSANRNLVTRALGIEPDVQVDITAHVIRPGDLLLLCSDGLNDMLDDEQIAEVLEMHQGDLTQTAGQLVQTANDLGGRDNISVILVRVLSEVSTQGGWWDKLLGKLK